MRISVRENDPGYHPQAYKCEPMLDGKKVKDCFTADEETGEVFCHARDEKGNFILNDKMTEVVEVVKKGKVSIIVPVGFRL